MKMKTLLILLLALCTCTMGFSQTRAEKRAKNRANQNVDRKIDQSVDKAFNKIEGLFKKKKKKKKEETKTTDTKTSEDQTDEQKEAEAEVQSQEMVSNILKRMGGNNEPWEPIKNEYLFSFDADVTITDKKNKVEKSHIQYVFDTWHTGMIYTLEDGNVVQMVMDNQEGSITMVMDEDGKKQGVKMRQPNVKYDESDFDHPDADEITMKKTGRTKTTEGGYFAHEYEMTSPDGTGTVWVTKDIPMDLMFAMQSALARSSKGNQKKRQQTPTFNNFGVEGFPVENHFVNKDGKEKVDMVMKNIKMGDKIDKTALDTKGIKVMDMGF